MARGKFEAAMMGMVGLAVLLVAVLAAGAEEGPATRPLGEVVEVTLNDMDEGAEKAVGLSLDKGLPVDYPPDFQEMPRDLREKWPAAAGVDLMVEHAGDQGWKLIAVSTELARMRGDAAGITIAEVKMALADETPGLPVVRESAYDVYTLGNPKLPVVLAFRTGEGTSGVLEVLRLEIRTTETGSIVKQAELRFRQLAVGTQGAVEVRQFVGTSINIVADAPVIRKLEDLEIVALARNLDALSVKEANWEIRRADNLRKLATIAMPWPVPAGWVPPAEGKLDPQERLERLKLSGQQVAQIGILPEGEYQLAWYVGGQRRSNVARFTINPKHELRTEPFLRLLKVEPAPGQEGPRLAVSVIRRSDADPVVGTRDVAYPSLAMNRKLHAPKTVPQWEVNRPLRVGERLTHILSWSTYGLELDVERRNLSGVVVGGRIESVTLALTGATPFGSAWDQAATTRPAEPPVE